MWALVPSKEHKDPSAIPSREDRRQKSLGFWQERAYFFLEVNVLDLVPIILELFNDSLYDVLQLSPSNEKV